MRVRELEPAAVAQRVSTQLSQDEWRIECHKHRERAQHWTLPHLERRRRGVRHPVLDFLFDYYPYSPGRLTTWHPGMGVGLVGDWRPPSSAGIYVTRDDSWMVDVNQVDHKRLAWTTQLLRSTQKRAPSFACFGMHEWAMVYRTSKAEMRHPNQALRVSASTVETTVEDLGLQCSHWDAFRFFTASAAPRNATQPTRSTQLVDDQPGCLHANMDLFKYAMWFQPFVPGSLVLDCFELAVRAREIDMRASPYDLAPLGYPAIAMEKPEGRAQYVLLQRGLSDQARPLREALLGLLDDLAKESSPPANSN